MKPSEISIRCLLSFTYARGVEKSSIAYSAVLQAHQEMQSIYSTVQGVRDTLLDSQAGYPFPLLGSARCGSCSVIM